MRKPRQAVTTAVHLGPRAFYTKDRARADKANQTTALPPRCADCRWPGRLRNPNDPNDLVLYCERHVPIRPPGCGSGACGACPNCRKRKGEDYPELYARDGSSTMQEERS